MDAQLFYFRIVQPTLTEVETITGIKVTKDAEIMVTAIAGQESNWQYRRQIGGPARSYWQFEEGGGVKGLFSVVPDKMKLICAAWDIPFDIGVVFEAMAWHDQLACAMARLLLWTDARPLPSNQEDGWNYYLDNWRPGAPHPDRWPLVYGMARRMVD